ncbi:MAG: helix-turn-helix domain-containing protein [Magnetospiraceae bacterium]
MKRKRTVQEHGPDPIDKYVGARIRNLRVMRRISQTALGESCGVTFQQIQKYENGANRIGSSNLYRIAKALEVDLNYFVDGMEGDLRRPSKVVPTDVLNATHDLETIPVEFRHVFTRAIRDGAKAFRQIANHYPIAAE